MKQGGGRGEVGSGSGGSCGRVVEESEVVVYMEFGLQALPQQLAVWRWWRRWGAPSKLEKVGRSSLPTHDIT